ncbi:MAG: DnaD domain protein, partial [Clostridia bacterium]|nr:DnaD domain protein [Clostridia bacterium]
MPVLSISKKSDSFSVSNQFVDKFMCDANGSFVKVYLYCLRYANSGESLSVPKIASVLNMIQSDVISALKYWDSVGVLKLDKNDKNDYSVELLDTFAEKSPERTYADTSDGEKKLLRSQTPYSRADLMTAMQGNEKIKQLFTLSSQLLNKTLNNNDLNIIYMLYDYLKFPPEVIFSLLEYCMSIGKNNMRYIEKVALTWADAEINTVAKAAAYIRARNKENAFIQKYKTMFKLVGRDFTESEIALLKTWV